MSIFSPTDNETLKRSHFGGLLKLHLDICKAKSANHPYLYIDMNAFDGTGSPRMFHDAAEKRGMNYRAYFLERERSCVGMMNLAYGDDPRVTILPGDHAMTAPLALEDYCDSLHRYPFLGMVYHDPQGCMSTETLVTLSRNWKLRKVDFVIHVLATSPKRIAGEERVIDAIRRIKKKYWLIREPSGKWQFTFLIGTNWANFPAWKKAKFAPINSEEGQSYADKLNFTTEERRYRNQPPLLSIQDLSGIPETPDVSGHPSAGATAG